MVQMSLKSDESNLEGEKAGNSTHSIVYDSNYFQRKRKPEFEETEINQSSRQAEQSSATFTPDDSDGEATGLSVLEIQGYRHVFKRRKATAASLLSGTPMEELCVVPSIMDSTSKSPAVTGGQHHEFKSECASPSTQTRPVGSLVNDVIENTIQDLPAERAHIAPRVQPVFSNKSSDERVGMVSILPSDFN